MGMFSWFGKRDSPATPRRKRRKDLFAFFQQETGDEELSQFMAEVVRKIGVQGYIEVRYGGYGNPYEVEFQERPENPKSAEEVRADLARLQEARKASPSEEERDRVEREMAKYVGAFCTVWINPLLPNYFERQRQLIKESFRKLKESD